MAELSSESQFITLKKHLLSYQNHFDFVYRKDNTRYVQECADECNELAYKCSWKVTCPICFKSICEKSLSISY
jgi:hypothetical protein